MQSNRLTAAHYTDASIFEKERDEIFSRCWYFAGLEEDLTEPNSYLTVQAGNNNIVVVCDEHKELRAFHNICRHRGMQIVEGQGKITTNRLTCPYHDWTYNWQGELKSLPKQKREFDGLNKACLSLKAAQVGIWRGMLWVHPNVDVDPVEHYFSAMNYHLAPYDVSELIESKDDIVDIEVKANWKLVVENYIDHYHLAQLHSGTLPMYDHQHAEFGFAGDHFYFWQPLKADYQENLLNNSYLPLIMDMDDERLGAYVPMLFPCLGLAENESSWSIFQVIPMEVDRTRVIIRTKVKDASSFEFIKQASKSSAYWQAKQKPKSSDYNKNHALGSADFMQEDVYVCEQMQKNLKSTYFEFGPSAQHGESSVRGFQERVLQWLQIKD